MLNMKSYNLYYLICSDIYWANHWALYLILRPQCSAYFYIKLMSIMSFMVYILLIHIILSVS